MSTNMPGFHFSVSIFLAFLHRFVLAKLDTSSMRSKLANLEDNYLLAR